MPIRTFMDLGKKIGGGIADQITVDQARNAYILYKKKGYELIFYDGNIHMAKDGRMIKIDPHGNVDDSNRPANVKGYVGQPYNETKKAKNMPKVEPEDGIERHDAYTRLNPKGHKEFVAADDEETLNELSDDVDELLEGIAFSGPKSTGAGAGSPEQAEYTRRRNKFTPELVDSDGDLGREAGDTITNMTYSTKQASDSPERLRATYKDKSSNKNIINHNGTSGMNEQQIESIAKVIEESFTGTGAIAIAPVGGHEIVSSKPNKKKKKKSKDLTETDMNRQKLSGAIQNILKEWQPTFNGGEYSPGEGGVEAPPGQGVADKNPKKDSTGKVSSDMKNHGDAFGASHSETVAMCDVDENGVETKPQGSHESSVGDPTDGYQSKVGHDWPAQPQLSGGAGEPVKGQSYSKGGVRGAEATDMEAGRTKGGPKMGNGMAEGWSPELVCNLMEGEDGQTQSLFDRYAKDYSIVCLEDFQAICNANAKGVTLDHSNLLQMMHNNKDFIFYEGTDANGPYWTPTPIAEVQIRPTPDAPDTDWLQDNKAHVGEFEKQDAMHGPGKFSGAGCPECGEQCDGPQCLNCGCDELGGGEGEGAFGGVEDEGFDEVDEVDEMFANFSAYDDDLGYDDFAHNVRNNLTASDDDYRTGRPPKRSSGNGDQLDISDFGLSQFEESLKQFLGSAKSILENSSGYDSNEVGQALVASWENYAGSINPSLIPKKIKSTLKGLSESFPAFNILEARESNIDALYKEWTQRVQEDPHQAATDWIEYIDAATAGGKRSQSAKALEQMLKNPDDAYNEQGRKIWHKHARNFEDAVQFAISSAIMSSGGLGVDHGGGGRGRNEGKEAGTLTAESNDAMGSPDGSELGTGGFKPAKMADQPSPDDDKDHGQPSSKHKQANSCNTTPVMKGTGKGMAESTMKQNVSKLSKHVKKALKENYGSLRGKVKGKYNVVVSENGVLNRTPKRASLTEALADAEEILQAHDSNNVDLEATFIDSKGSVVLQQEVPLFTIKPRGIMQSEGAGIFRFKRTAERYANYLVAEGKVCRVIPHNWGHSVLGE